MAKSASYSAYDQVAVPSAGTTTPSGKMTHPDTKNDALGCPEMYSRNKTTVASEEHDVKSLRDKQLGSNGVQGN